MLEEGRELTRVYCAGGAGGEGPCWRCAGRGRARGAGRGASPLACLSVCALVLAYNLLGGVLFLALEGGGGGGGGGAGAEETAVAASKPDPSAGGAARGAALRARAVDRLWAITEDLNILYKENWTALAARELLAFQRALLPPPRAPPRAARRAPRPAPHHRWTFSTSSLYALTLITTIGHGDVTPSSASGKMAAVVYASAGIPLVMLYLACVGGALARGARGAWARVRPPRPAPPRPAPGRTPFQAALNLASVRPAARAGAGAGGGGVPAPLSLALLLLYVAAGAALFRATEHWDLLDGGFFAFCSLATIGFGDLRPGRRAAAATAAAEDLALAACCLYILVGVVVVAMCFDLLQEQLSAVLRRAGARARGGGGARAVHAQDCEEKAALALVS